MSTKNETVDLLDSVELKGITKEELSKMSTKELKDFQKNQSDNEISDIKNRIRFSQISALFFLFCTIFLYTHPIYSVYMFIIPTIIVLIFSLKTYILMVKLNFYKTSRRMLELFYEDIGV